MNIFIEGFVLQASLILALGAQNIFVLESGLKKQKHLLVASVCSLCDLVLVLIGVIGAASIFVAFPLLKVGVGLLGISFLFYYAFVKIKESFQQSSAFKTSEHKTLSTKQVILTSLAFSLLNPHVYLDTVILIGGYSSKFPELVHRLKFGFGAIAFSILWFYSLATSSAALSKLLSEPKTMKRISFVSGLILLWMGLKLSFDIFQWL